jgi:hypothetical protein
MVIKRVKGDTYSLDITIEYANGNAVNLTGATVFFTVKRNIQDTDAQALISKTITSFTSPTTGQVSITLLAADVDYVGEFYYDVKVKFSTGDIASVFANKFILANHVTIRTS